MNNTKIKKDLWCKKILIKSEKRISERSELLMYLIEALIIDEFICKLNLQFLSNNISTKYHE